MTNLAKIFSINLLLFSLITITLPGHADDSITGAGTIDLMLETLIKNQKDAEKKCPKGIKEFADRFEYQNAQWTGEWENLSNGKCVCYMTYTPKSR